MLESNVFIGTEAARKSPNVMVVVMLGVGGIGVIFFPSHWGRIQISQSSPKESKGRVKVLYRPLFSGCLGERAWASR